MAGIGVQNDNNTESLLFGRDDMHNWNVDIYVWVTCLSRRHLQLDTASSAAFGNSECSNRIRSKMLCRRRSQEENRDGDMIVVNEQRVLLLFGRPGF